MVFFIKKSSFFILFFFILIVSGLSFAGDSSIPQNKKSLLQVKETSHDLGIIQKGMEFGYPFFFENKGHADLKLLKAVGKTPGEIQVQMPSIIPAGEERPVFIAQDSHGIRGAHALEVLIQTNDPHQPEVLLTLQGYVQWPVEILPRPWALMKAQKGQSGKKQFTMVNHTKTPLKIKKIELDENLFQVETRELEKGKKFELTVLSQTSAPLGEHRKRIVFHTNVPEVPTVTMAAWIKVRERIFTNLQILDFGERFFEDINNPQVVEMTTETVIINGMSTPGFKVLKAECNIDFLKVDLSPIAKNNIHRVDVYFQPEKAKKGEFKGSLTISTNDEEFKQIVLPIHGNLY